MLMINKPLSAEQRLTKAVIDIMGKDKYIALCGVLMVGTREVDDSIATACTNGRDEKYGRAFVESLNDAELRFLVLHECYHKLYQHLTTWKHLYDENAEIANVACDHVINIKISDDNTDGFARMPRDKQGNNLGAMDVRFRDMNAAAVYNILKQENPQQPQQPKQPKQGAGAGAPSAGTGIDSHDWEGAEDMPVEEQQELKRNLDEALRQGALMAGKMGSGGDRSIGELLQSKIDWREALREFLSTTCVGNDYSTWRRPNRRFISSGYYMPSGISEQVGELVVAIDTSGSIGQRELSKFLGEVKAICDTVHPECVRLLYWDTAVCADERYVGTDVENIVASTKPAGGGGTDVTCVTAHMSKHNIKPQAVIVLTDGYLGGQWGQWTVPVLWCIVGGNRSVANCGKTIHVQD